MPKILQMPKSAQRIAHETSTFDTVHHVEAFQLPLDTVEEKAGFEKITKLWLSWLMRL